MNRIDPRNFRLNDVFFAAVLGTAVACTGWIAMAGAHAAEPVIAAVATAPVQLERVVITGKRLDRQAIARAGSRDSEV